MKNSKEYSEQLHKLQRGLVRAHTKIDKTIHDDPIDALIYGVISEKLPDSSAQRAMKEFRHTFVDWNDLRVARPEEIVEILQEDTTVSRAAAVSLTSALRAVFDEYHVVSLETLKKMGKRPAKQVLETLDGVSPYVVSYCMLTSLQGHAIPLTEQMVDYLKRNGIVDPDADLHDIEGFLTRQVAAKDAYEFYGTLRRESESPKLVKKTRKKRLQTKKVVKAKK